MIQHILKLIWNQRRQNGWLWAELLLVSVILWFLVDYLYVMGRTYTKPMGFDIEHTYFLAFDNLAEGATGYVPKEERERTDGALMLELLDRLRSNPDVEAVCYADMGVPYRLGNRQMNWSIDTVVVNLRYRQVSPDYFQVFGSRDEPERNEALAAALREADAVVLSEDFARREYPDFRPAVGQEVTSYSERKYKVTGLCSVSRPSRYEREVPFVYIPLPASYLEEGGFDGNMQSLEVAMRVRPEADTPEFIDRLRAELKTQARAGNFYLLDIVPFSTLRAEYIRGYGLENEARTYVAIAVFLLVNIFLGVIGTFWFRSEYRKGEMGLRMALGSSRGQLRGILAGEGLMLLALAFVPAFVVSFNIAQLELLDTELLPFTAGRFLACQAITFCVIAGMIVCGVWYPARQAARMEPAEALRYE